MSVTTNNLRAELARQREQRSRAWASYFDARRARRLTLEEMDALVDAIARAHAQVKKIESDLQHAERRDRANEITIAEWQREAAASK
jgi:hypothetical protein